MDGFLNQLYLSEIATQCKFLLMGDDQLAGIATQRERDMAEVSKIMREEREHDPATRPPGAKRMMERLGAAERLPRGTTPEFYAIQNILSAAANLSKILWGNSDVVAGERRDLRDALEVTDKSPLRSKNVRNSFEHFDERIAEWYGKTPTWTFIGRNMGPMPKDRNALFGHYDPTTGEVAFHGHSTSIPDLVAEAARILPLARNQM